MYILYTYIYILAILLYLMPTKQIYLNDETYSKLAGTENVSALISSLLNEYFDDIENPTVEELNEAERKTLQKATEIKEKRDKVIDEQRRAVIAKQRESDRAERIGNAKTNRTADRRKYGKEYEEWCKTHSWREKCFDDFVKDKKKEGKNGK